MRRRAEPSRTDRLIQGALIALVAGVAVYAIHFVATIEDHIQPIPPTSRPASVPADATWLGPEGYKEGWWTACSPIEREDTAYLCTTWSRAGVRIEDVPYRVAERKAGAPRAAIVERWEGGALYLRGGTRLEPAPRPPGTKRPASGPDPEAG